MSIVEAAREILRLSHAVTLPGRSHEDMEHRVALIHRHAEEMARVVVAADKFVDAWDVPFNIAVIHDGECGGPLCDCGASNAFKEIKLKVVALRAALAGEAPHA